jgi:hypothetical protein
MKCDELKPLVFSLNDLAYIDESAVKKNFENPHDHAVYKATEVDAAIEELKNKLEDAEATAYAESVDAGMENYNLKRSLWLMTAEWAEAMGLASCNIAIKLSVKERFFYHDEANREKDIKKYRHRQVVFYKYADYCRKKAEEYK